MTAYTDVYNWVLPHVPMCPPILATNAIRDAVIELCERSLIYRQELQQILVLAPVSTETTATSAAAATSITVDDITDFDDGDTLTVVLEDGTKWRGHVSGTPAGSTINLDGALPDDVEVGAAVTKFVDLYTITLPSETAFAKALKVWLNDNELDPISEDDLSTEFGGVSPRLTNWRTDVALPTRFYFPDDTTIGLATPPDLGGALRILAALKPSATSTTFPTWIFDRYRETIAVGARWKLMSIPKKPYTDMALASHYMNEFQGLIGEARIRAAKSGSRAPLRTHTVFNLR